MPNVTSSLIFLPRQIIPKSLHEVETLPTRTSAISTPLLTRNTSLYYHSPQPSLEHNLSTQCPTFHLHISILNDTTVLSLTFPHVLMDAGGASEIMRGLVCALEGKGPKPQLAADPWADIAALSKDREPTRGWTTYGPKEFALAQDVESNDLDRDGPIRQRTIYFPYAEIERLKSEAMRELEWMGVKVPFLSSGDVIVAWLYKQFYGDEQYSPERTSRLLYILDARLRLPDTFPSTHVHLKNGYLVLAAQAHANSTISSLSLGEVALMVRELVNEGSRRDEIVKGVRWKYESVGGVRVPAPAGERVLFASNWLTFELGELNLAGVVRPGSGTGKVLDVYCGMPGIPRCSGVITYRDSDGGVSATFDWGERNWTSGTIGEFAIDKLSNLNSLQIGSKERNGEERVVGVIEKGVWTWKTVQSLISWWRLTFGLGELNFASVVRPGSGTGKVLDVYCGMPGIPRCSGVITYRDSDGGVSAAFDWGERNWTSGTIGEFAIEKFSSLNSLQVGSKERNVEERVIGVIEKGVWTWKTVRSLISWWRRLLHL
ncbi:hypothetical protein BDV93DRAFT_558689 [Ceratobasidium sp. AG-I]|nr:hypothetical protein BDV93DRAFT_558689 [Ceratobasidium sp. AG-I]